MKKIKGVKILLESDRHIGDNPLDFLQTNHIQNGQYVSIGYLKEEKLSTKARYINAENDAELGDAVAKAADTRFGKDFANVRQGAKYQKALSGEAKTGTFDVEGVHILKLGRYNFQWKNAERKRRDYEERELPLLQAVRKHHGFTEFEPENVDPEDWHAKKKIGKDGKEKFVYGGAGIYPIVADEDKEKGMGWRPIGGGEADFFEHENTRNISFRQVLGKSNMRAYQFYYANEEDGVLEPFDRATYKFLANAFGRPKVDEVCDELLDQERAFIADMEELNSRFNHRTFDWDKILYMAASTVGADEDGKKVYEPFVWINDAVIKQTYPWLSDESLKAIIEESVRVSKNDLEEWEKTPKVWESKNVNNANALSESIMKGVKKALNESLAFEPYSCWIVAVDNDVLNGLVAIVWKNNGVAPDMSDPREFDTIVDYVANTNKEGIFDFLKNYKVDNIVYDCQNSLDILNKILD